MVLFLPLVGKKGEMGQLERSGCSKLQVLAQPSVPPVEIPSPHP